MNMDFYIGGIGILISFVITALVLPFWIRRAKKIYGIDVHKKGSKKVVEMGGIVVVFGAVLGILVYIALKTFLVNNDLFTDLFAALCSILVATVIGIIDNMLGWRIGLRQYQKVLLSVLIPIPLMVINAGHSSMSLPFFGVTELGILYPLLIIPIGIIGASNGFNMLAGYNGLEAGMGIIILSTLGFLAWVLDANSAVILTFCFVAALVAFLIFNWYPSKVFPGDTLTYSVGAAIAIVAILADIEKFAVILFIPYYIEFILKARKRFVPDWTARVLKDGSLAVKDKWYTLPHVFISFLQKLKHKAYEYEVVSLILFAELVLALITVFVIF